MVWLTENSADSPDSLREMQFRWWDCVGELLKRADRCGFRGNLWHCCLAHLLVNDENSYSLSCERRGETGGSLKLAALHDMTILRELFALDLVELMSRLQVSGEELVLDYEPGSGRGRGYAYSLQIRDEICRLAKGLAKAHGCEEFKAMLTEFYRSFGVGKPGLHRAFRIGEEESGACILPICDIAPVCLEDLVGYEMAKKKLTDNTEAFVRGRGGNNCLLYGAAGTGKSSAIKAIVNAYYGEGLRMIEVYKHQFRKLHDVTAQIKNRNYKFILYMDDLSFEEFETEYKYLKAVIEGGLEKKPDNVRIYATSNRRHLIRENYSDKQEGSDDLHSNETVQEKLSLAGRFGMTVYFPPPEKREFHEIVKVLAKRSGIDLSEEELLAAANRWELAHGGPSGRTARQFVDDLLGRMQRE